MEWNFIMGNLHFCFHGAGGLGSLIGGFLARDGHKVTLIGRGSHVKAINASGLSIEGVRANFVTGIHQAITLPDQIDDSEIDYYVLCTKSKGSVQALSDAACIRDRVKTAVSIQNGVGKEVRLIEAFGEDKVIGGSIMDGATLLEPGKVLNHMKVPVTAYFGELNGGQTDRTRAIAKAFDHAGLGCRSVDDIQHVLWEKIFQVGTASTWSASTLAGVPSLDFADGLIVREGAEHFVQISKEMISIYRAMGFAPQNFFAPVSQLKEIDESDFEDAVEAAMAMGKRFLNGKRPVRTSMHEDLISGRSMEVDEILGSIYEQAKRHKINAPTFIGAYRILKTLNANL
jgi:2-dehydropantoate 2-reductase